MRNARMKFLLDVATVACFTLLVVTFGNINARPLGIFDAGTSMDFIGLVGGSFGMLGFFLARIAQD